MTLYFNSGRHIVTQKKKPVCCILVNAAAFNFMLFDENTFLIFS